MSHFIWWCILKWIFSVGENEVNWQLFSIKFVRFLLSKKLLNKGLFVSMLKSPIIRWLSYLVAKWSIIIVKEYVKNLPSWDGAQ